MRYGVLLIQRGLQIAGKAFIWLVIIIATSSFGYYGYVTYRSSVSLHAVSELRQTMPVVDHQPLVFFLVGDTGTGRQAQLDVAAAMERRCIQRGRPAGLMLLGDNFYQRGIDSPYAPEIDQKFREPYASPCLRDVPVFPVLGNHDHKGRAEAQVAYSLVNPRWRMPGRMYTVRFGSIVEFFALDTGFVDVLISTPGGYRGFMKQALADSPATWKLALGHHPHASGCSDRPYREDPLRAYAISQLLCGRVDAYVGGHMHFMERVFDSETCPQQMFIAGSGGAPLRPFDEPNCHQRTQFAASNYGFLALEASQQRLNWKFIDLNDTTLHEYNQTSPFTQGSSSP